MSLAYCIVLISVSDPYSFYMDPDSAKKLKKDPIPGPA